MNCHKKCTQNENFCKGNSCKKCCCGVLDEMNVEKNKHAKKGIGDIVKLTFSEGEEYCFNEEEIEKLKEIVTFLEQHNLSFTDFLQFSVSVVNGTKCINVLFKKKEFDDVKEKITYVGRKNKIRQKASSMRATRKKYVKKREK